MNFTVVAGRWTAGSQILVGTQVSGLYCKGKEINLEVKVDKSILGGGIIKIGDKIIDGSIRRELDNWKKS